MRAILFGASKAGAFFISQHPDLNIIAIADNDSARHGDLLKGIPIISPDSLAAMHFDQIIITSQWVDAIHLQLTETLGIEEHLINIPAKHQVKAAQPFSHPPTLALAHTLLIRLHQFLVNHGIRACLDSGTLLGVIRQNALIPWDDDIDLAVDSATFSHLISVMPAFFCHLPFSDRLNWHIHVIHVNGRPSCINIEFDEPEDKSVIPFDVSLQMRENRDGSSELVSSAGLFFAPAHHFEHFETIKFLQQDFYIPTDSDGFLTFMYGNWREPQKNTRITEYQNRRANLPVDATQVKVVKSDLKPRSE